MKPLAITCGDPAGIGPEVIASWLAHAPRSGLPLVVLGPARWLETLDPGIDRVAIGREDYEAVPGRPEGEGALLAWAAMQRAADGCAAGEFSGVVTAPVSKVRLAAVGFKHPGQTEFFAAAWGGDPVMAFCGGRLRVVLATWHIPFHEVPKRLGPHQLHRAVEAASLLARKWGAQTPRIGVCGLNPHAGEGGLLGLEEQDFLNPTLRHLRDEYPGLSECLPADTIFHRTLRGEFDAVVALYHDQGLAPLKTVEFDEAVNVTLGLRFIRTSPDHGTAFDLAGKGQASHRSFGNAVEVARRLVAF